MSGFSFQIFLCVPKNYQFLESSPTVINCRFTEALVQKPFPGKPLILDGGHGR